MSERIERCETCRWWSRPDGIMGTCKRSAPMAVATVYLRAGLKLAYKHKIEAGGICDPLLAVWPYTEIDDFCGEWQPTPAAPE